MKSNKKTRRNARAAKKIAALPTCLPAPFHNLPDHVQKPGYDKALISAGILHIGLGNFALAHMCDIVHNLLADQANHKWGIVAASLRSGNLLNALGDDNLYVLVEKLGSERHAKVMAPIVDTIFAPEDPTKLVTALANPDIKLVTMTVSEKGYCLANGELDLKNEHIVHDLTEPTVPQTIFWYLEKGLAERAKHNTPLVIMSLDNVETNSKQLRKALLAYLAVTNPALVSWVEENCDFPVTLVDRITPGVKEDFRHEVRQLLGFDAGMIVGTEKFWQLVCENTRFEMPPFEQVGVKMVDSCSTYWPRKYYMLNAVHQVLGITGQRLGVEYIHQAMQHQALSALAKRAHEEFRCFLVIDDEEFLSYSDIVLGRFSDPSMEDTMYRVTKGTTRKVSERVLSSVELALNAGGKMPSAAIFTAAAWAHNLGGCDEYAQPIPNEDADADKLAEIYSEFAQQLEVQGRARHTDKSHKRGVQTVRDFLVNVGTTLRDARISRLAANEAFVEEFARWVMAIEEHGVEAAIKMLLEIDTETKTAA